MEIDVPPVSLCGDHRTMSYNVRNKNDLSLHYNYNTDQAPAINQGPCYVKNDLTPLCIEAAASIDQKLDAPSRRSIKTRHYYDHEMHKTTCNCAHLVPDFFSCTWCVAFSPKIYQLFCHHVIAMPILDTDFQSLPKTNAIYIIYVAYDFFSRSTFLLVDCNFGWHEISKIFKFEGTHPYKRNIY